MSIDAYNRYMGLVQQGVPYQQAYMESGLGDIALQQQRAQEEAVREQQQILASQQGRAERASVGGQLVGALGAKAAMDYATNKPILGGAVDKITGLFSSTPATTAPVTTPAAPQILSASRVPTPTTPAPAPGLTLGKALGGAGVALGSYQAYRGIEEKDPMAAGLGGLGIGAGLSQLGLALGPIGWAAAIGVPVAAALINEMGDKDRWKEEYDRKKKLVEEGIIPESMLGPEPTRGRSKEELVALEEQKIAQGQYGNPEFARSRNVKDLRAEDIWGFSVAPETLGASYMQASEEQRRAYNQQLLDEGLVREARGQISYTDKGRAKEIWQSITGQEPQEVK